MTTELTHRHAGKTKENAQAGKTPAKGNLLFRKIAPLVAAGFLAAGCGGAQAPQICQKTPQGDYLINENCITPKDEVVWQPELKKETETGEKFSPEVIAAIEPFAKKVYYGGVGWLKQISEEGEKNYFHPEDGSIVEKRFLDTFVRITADYATGHLSVKFISDRPLVQGGRAKIPDNLSVVGKANVGGANENEIVTPANMLSHQIAESQKVERSENYTPYINSPAPEGPSTIASFEVRATSPEDCRISFTRTTFGRNNIYLVSAQDDKVAYALLISEIPIVGHSESFMRTAWAVLDLTKAEVNLKDLTFVFVAIDDNSYVVAMNKKVSPKSEVFPIPLFKTDLGHYQPKMDENGSAVIFPLTYDLISQL